jgi:hypothetical protein
MKSLSIAMLTLTSFFLSVPHDVALADENGDKSLAVVETALNRAKSHYFEFEALTTQAGKPEKKAALNVWIKGDKRLLEFTAPADLKGTKLLVLSPTEMYIFLPSFGKVRRLAANTSAQGLLGAAFSAEDFATQRYSSQYTASSASNVLTLTPKPNQTPSYAKIELAILPDKNLPTELKYTKSDGKLTRTETRSGYTCGKGAAVDICTPGKTQMVDHSTGLTTLLVRKVWKVNESISDDVFSQRTLGQ